MGENLQLLGGKSANESIHSLTNFIRYIKITIQSEVEDYSIMNARSKLYNADNPPLTIVGNIEPQVLYKGDSNRHQ